MNNLYRFLAVLLFWATGLILILNEQVIIGSIVLFASLVLTLIAFGAMEEKKK